MGRLFMCPVPLMQYELRLLYMLILSVDGSYCKIWYAVKLYINTTESLLRCQGAHPAHFCRSFLFSV